MAKERDAEAEELGPDPEDPAGFSPGIMTIIVGVLITIISIIFLYILSIKTPATFGFAQVLYSIALGIVSMFFLYWIHLFMRKNPYLSLIIGLVALAACIYALFVRYKGPYTTTFAIILGLIVLVYLFMQFAKAKKMN